MVYIYIDKNGVNALMFNALIGGVRSLRALLEQCLERPVNSDGGGERRWGQTRWLGTFPSRRPRLPFPLSRPRRWPHL